MRNSIVFYLNGDRHEVTGKAALMNVSEYLRYQKGLTGTKVVCAEGDCGACTVLQSRVRDGKLGGYRTLNSCIAPVFSLDLSHLITVEGLKCGENLHPVQSAMVKCHGAQCGYCTPGFICSMASMADDVLKDGSTIDRKKVQNYTTGNLCRCTGYEPIIEAGCAIDLNHVPELSSLYRDQDIEKDLASFEGDSVYVSEGEQEVFLPVSLAEALKVKTEKAGAKLTSGSTDLGVLKNKRNQTLKTALSLQGVSDVCEIRDDESFLSVGARVSLSDLEEATRDLFPDFSELLHVFASPQIKNTGTLVGNLMNASPIADTIPFLRVAEAQVVLQSLRGERILNINDFIRPGYKQLDLNADEILTHIRIPKTQDRFKLYKVSARRDLDISSVTFAARYRLQGDQFQEFALALGGVGASVLRMTQIEQSLIGQRLDQALFKTLALSLRGLLQPVSDVRGSAEFRQQLCHNLLLKFFDDVSSDLSGRTLEVSV